MGVVDALTRTGGRDVISAQVPLLTAIIEIGIFIIGALLIVVRWRRTLRAARLVWPLLAFTALAPLSMIWSEQPLLTLRTSILFMCSTLLAIYLGERYSIETLAGFLNWCLCLTMLLVISLYFVSPTYVIDYASYPPAWKGLAGHKNAFGGYMAIAVPLLLIHRFRNYRWLRYLFLFTGVVLLVLSRSVTALLVCVLVVAAMPLWRFTQSKRQRLPIYMMMAFSCLSGFYLISGKLSLLFPLLGRDSSLSGRTNLWSALLPAILKHPILGYGYYAFWTGLKGEVLNVWIVTKWMAPAADNGYIDLCLGLGLLGVCAFICVFLYSFRMATSYLRSEAGSIRLWPVTYLCLFALQSITESHLVSTRSIEFLMFAALTTSLAVNRQERKRAYIAVIPEPALGNARAAPEFCQQGTSTRSLG